MKLCTNCGYQTQDDVVTALCARCNHVLPGVPLELNHPRDYHRSISRDSDDIK